MVLDGEGEWCEVKKESFDSLDIVVAEARMIQSALVYAKLQAFTDVVFLSDSRPAQLATIKGYSGVDPLDQVMVAMPREGLRLVLADTPTDANIADVGTRPSREVTSEEREQRANDSRRRARDAIDEWALFG